MICGARQVADGKANSMSDIEANDSPSLDELATTALASFGTAIRAFSEFWHAGWHAPANERACVARVAADLSNKFRGTIEPWCDVPLGVLFRWKGYREISNDISKRGPIDLVLCKKTDKSIFALLEFKTHDFTEDIDKLTRVGKLLRVKNLILVACDHARVNVDQDSTLRLLDERVDTSLRGAQSGWRASIILDQPHIDISGLDGDKWLVRPFALWKSD